MDISITNAFVLPESNLKLAKKCLALIRDIAAEGACSENPEDIGYALQELTQVLFERTGSDERVFEPVTADAITDLGKLLDELEFVASFFPSIPTSADFGAGA